MLRHLDHDTLRVASFSTQGDIPHPLFYHRDPIWADVLIREIQAINFSMLVLLMVLSCFPWARAWHADLKGLQVQPRPP